MVMLDMLTNFDDNYKKSVGYDFIVAHFDHGTRASSKADAEFVAKYVKDHSLPFALGTATLGENVSEENARVARYGFLKIISGENDGAEIYTAHHLDDLVESIAINLLRGTGWRGLAVLDTPGIRRPFLEPELLPEILRNLVPPSKADIQYYAARFGVIYRQDPTNNEDNYLRNRVREKLIEFPIAKKTELYRLWQEQKNIKSEIDNIIQKLLPEPGAPWQRSWFRDLDEVIALELLRAGTLRAEISATRPQLKDFRQAILDYESGKYFNLPQDRLVKFSKTEFYL